MRLSRVFQLIDYSDLIDNTKPLKLFFLLKYYYPFTNYFRNIEKIGLFMITKLLALSVTKYHCVLNSFTNIINVLSGGGSSFCGTNRLW